MLGAHVVKPGSVVMGFGMLLHVMGWWCVMTCRSGWSCCYVHFIVMIDHIMSSLNE
jgi:hypothetical protein